MNFMKTLSSLAFMFASGPAIAQVFSQCDAALVESTYTSNDKFKSDWRLALFVNKEEYDKATHNGSIEAVIYGVPTSGSYDDFHNRIEKYSQQTNASLRVEQLRNILWTGLNSNSSNAYTSCLNAVVLTSRGLHFVPRFATASDIAFTLQYVPQGSDPTILAISWVGRSEVTQSLPKTITAGSTTIIVPRPDQEQSLGVNGFGPSDVVTIGPLPPPPPSIPAPVIIPPPPRYKAETRVCFGDGRSPHGDCLHGADRAANCGEGNAYGKDIDKRLAEEYCYNLGGTKADVHNYFDVGGGGCGWTGKVILCGNQ